MDRKKELKEQYKQMRPQMGVYLLRCRQADRVYIGASQNIKGMLNRIRFQLAAGSIPNRRLQKIWDDYGNDSFTEEVVEVLEYGRDESKTDYTEELEILKEMCKEKYREAEEIK